MEVPDNEADHERGTVYDFTKFKKIMEAAQGQGTVPQMIDIVGVIMEVQPLGQIQLKNTTRKQPQVLVTNETFKIRLMRNT